MGRAAKTFGIPGTRANGKGRGKFVKRVNADTPGFTDVTTANSAEDRFAERKIASGIDGKSLVASCDF